MFDNGFAEGGIYVLNKGNLTIENFIGPDGVGDHNRESGVFEMLHLEIFCGVFGEYFWFEFDEFGAYRCGSHHLGHTVTGNSFLEEVLEGGEHEISR